MEYEQVKDCGCIYIVRDLPLDPKYPKFRGSVTRFKLHNGIPMECEMHIQRRKDERERQKFADIKTLENAEELLCYQCKRVMGYVSIRDLEGSTFFCIDCKNNE